MPMMSTRKRWYARFASLLALVVVLLPLLPKQVQYHCQTTGEIQSRCCCDASIAPADDADRADRGCCKIITHKASAHATQPELPNAPVYAPVFVTLYHAIPTTFTLSTPCHRATGGVPRAPPPGIDVPYLHWTGLLT